MELLVLSGLAFIGYELSKDDKTPRRKLKDCKVLQNNNKYPIESDTHPEIPVPKHNNMVPYFTSAKSQNTNGDYKQRSLETFTGTDDLSFQSKRESEALFQPQANLSNVNGMQLSLDDSNRKQRYASTITDIMNNVAPIEKQYVGPGLNTNPDVASKGGYHDMYRILPDNIHAYKKNNFGGRVLAGKGVTNQRNAAPVVTDHKKPNRYYTLCDVPVTQNAAPVSAQSVRGNTILQDTQRGNCNVDVGIAGPAAMADALQSIPAGATRTFDRTHCVSHGNPSMPGNGAGAYTTTSVLVNEGQREQCGEAINAQNQHMGSGVYITDGAGPTQRGDVNKYTGQAHNSSVVATSTYNGYTADATIREQTTSSYSGNPNQSGSASGTRTYQANPTLRGNNINNYNTPAGSIHKAGITYSTAQNASVYKQREEMAKGYTPGAGNMNLRADAQELLPHMIVKEDCNAMSHVAPIKGPNAVSFSDQMGSVEITAKLPVHNNRLDLNIAQNQMSKNDVAHNINARQ